MLLADVAGHGATVARLAADLRKIMHRYINSIRPRRLFDEVNADFAAISSGDRFATSIISSYFMPTSTLSICNAGHPTPLIRRASSRQWEPLEDECHSADLPLGIAESARYAQFDIPVKTGDLVLSYTDGVIESAGPDGKQWGIDGLQSRLNALPADRPERILAELVEQVSGSPNGGDHDDDVTILLYRIADRPVPMRDNLAAPWRWLRGLFAKR
jgi:serine phosphatase RsbU (regulator of sigma subunit)